ncbi:hypothetical protein BOX30_04080 [Leptospirillum ferriphilum]|nr:hypothetical protein BOX30_04080 [Leptospirillum ferriphilum]
MGLNLTGKGGSVRGRYNLVLLKALSSFMRQIRLFFSSRVQDILPEIPFDRSLAVFGRSPQKNIFPGRRREAWRSSVRKSEISLWFLVFFTSGGMLEVSLSGEGDSP